MKDDKLSASRANAVVNRRSSQARGKKPPTRGKTGSKNLKAFKFLDYKLIKKRARIDKLDSQIVKLLVKRLRIVREIGVIKKSIKYPKHDRKREKEIIARLNFYFSSSLRQQITEIYRTIIRVSRELQK